MSSSQTSRDGINQMFQTATFGTESLARATRGFELWMESLMTVAIHQIELSQSLVSGGLADLDTLTRATTAAALVQAQFEVVQQRSERVMSAARMIADDLNRSWTEAFALMGGGRQPR